MFFVVKSWGFGIWITGEKLRDEDWELKQEMLVRGIKRKVNANRVVDVPPSKVLRKSDQYGCVNWQPEMLPGDETIGTQKVKQDDLLKLSSLIPPGNIGEENLKFLLKSHIVARDWILDMNVLTDLKTLLMSWPMLFCEKGFFAKF